MTEDITGDPRAADALEHLLNAATELIAAARAALDVAETVVDTQRDLLTNRKAQPEPKVQPIRVMEQ
jgi:hypothetical protein